MQRKTGWSESKIFLATFLSYVLLGIVGKVFAPPPGAASPVWAPSGIALVAFIWTATFPDKRPVFSPSAIMATFLGGFTAGIIIPIFANGRLAFSMGLLMSALLGALGATLSAWVGSKLILASHRRQDLLKTLNSVVSFILAGAFLSSLLSAIPGVIGLCLFGGLGWRHFFSVATTWYLGDALGVLIAAPLLLLLPKPLPLPRSYLKAFEGFCLIGLIVFVSQATFLTPSFDHSFHPRTFLAFPLLGWAAIRFHSCFTSFLALVVNAIALWGTGHGLGPFADQVHQGSALWIEIYVATTATMALLLAAAINEKETVNSRLEEQVHQRTLDLLQANQALSDEMRERKNAEAHLEEQRQLAIHAMKLAALGEMASGIAHEINTPLAIIRMAAHAISRQMAAPTNEIARKAELISKTVDRIAKIVTGLRLFAREGQSLPMEEAEIGTLVEQTLSLCREKISNEGIPIKIELSDERHLLRCRSVEVSQVLLNLISNAYYAVRSLPEPWIRIETYKTPYDFRISVSDSGAGVPEDIKEKIFNPFFTTKPPGDGTGLGLSISKSLIEKAGGMLFLDHTVAHTRFTIILPNKPETDLPQAKHSGISETFPGFHTPAKSPETTHP